MYSLSYRRRFSPLKSTILGVLGHSYNQQTDKLWILTATGGREIACWSKCEISLGPDWKAHVEVLEKEHLTREAKA